ncbi:MAG: 4-(cytidine 5'-diphospho)-2-C-methyl-D-erythritol kinase [Flavobacteriales bacterium]|nr:4-(cytidine 5'-diphospho)-2-C-methyl-D-erythritol kinase [Flavobacteriales bacterium]
MLLFANAKINIGLQIINKRKDGFHNIKSIFYPIDVCDILEIHESADFQLYTTGIEIPGGSSNTVISAFEFLKKDFKIPAVRVHLHKVIPIGAGLGGGSSDGVAALKGLIHYFNLNVTKDQLRNYCLKMGSDCAFFIENQPTLASEKGDVFQDIDLSLKGKFIYLFYPNIFVSTQEAYDGVLPSQASFELSNTPDIHLKDWKEMVFNDFETSVFSKHKILRTIKQGFYEHGALYSSMSGSGSTIYGIFEVEPKEIKFPCEGKSFIRKLG